MEKSSTGLEANIAAGLAVVFGWVGGLLFILLEKQSSFVRFYGFQSLALAAICIAVALAGFLIGLVPMPGVPFLGRLVSAVLGVIPTLLWVFLVINAFTGKVWEIPVIGKWCRQQAGL